jgi:hypothetical protein
VSSENRKVPGAPELGWVRWRRPVEPLMLFCSWSEAMRRLRSRLSSPPAAEASPLAVLPGASSMLP